MEMKMLLAEQEKYVAEVAELLVENFPSYQDCSLEEMVHCLDAERIAIVAVDEGKVVGFIGAIPQYGITGWELHPLVVSKSRQQRGIGTQLLHALEAEVASRGGVTIYLGTDDEERRTTLSDTDLYQDTYAKIDTVKNLHHHPFEFYQKNGYKIVGVLPDANGIGKPDIWMAKRVLK